MTAEETEFVKVPAMWDTVMEVVDRYTRDGIEMVTVRDDDDTDHDIAADDVKPLGMGRWL